LSYVEEGKGTVIRTTYDCIWVLVVEGHTTEWRGWKKCFLREVRICKIPNVRFTRHVLRHLLETEHGITDTCSQFAGIWVPNNSGGGPLEAVGVLKNHLSFERDGLGEIFSFLTMEIFLE